ncbi:MAG TPA: YqhG family protein [Cerasibacillus sp.]|uniref:YqhG family protein n=1 Tax=Cerasibacillus sp. TaxID=2498711 RepID=UPI002F4288E5
MALSQLDHFFSTYFKAHQCDVHLKENGILKVQLTKEMDQALMNRPFYWHYMEKTGQTGEPMQLTIITDPSHPDQQPGEWGHLGSPRLQQIIDHLKMNETHAKLYHHISPTTETPLYPWLVTNIKIIYQGKQTREELFSIGLNLINGMMQTNMMEALNTLSFQRTIPDFCFPLSPLIRLKSGYRRIENVLKQYINDQDHTWVKETLDMREHELSLLQHFYETGDEEHEALYKKEETDIKNRLQPKIHVHVINGGLFYLNQSFQHNQK